MQVATSDEIVIKEDTTEFLSLLEELVLLVRIRVEALEEIESKN